MCQWKTACQNEKFELDCGRGSTVRIIDAEYGRRDGTTCHHYPNFFMSCYSTEAYYKVHQRCDNKEKCSLTVSIDEFGDPCPGIIKYLKVKYRCEPVEPNSLQTEIACDGDAKTIKCPKGKSLSITHATYGRTDLTTCPHTSITDVNCKAENVLDILSSKCDNRQECDLNFFQNWFNDPCNGTSKYLTVDYQCVVEDIQYALACENSNLELKCKNSSVINVVRADYGRLHPFICNSNPEPIASKGCSSPNEITFVYVRCNGKPKCVLPSSNEVFGDACKGTSKYLELDYFCGEIWNEEDSPGAPIIKAVTKDSVTFTSEKLNKLTSKKYIVQIKVADKDEWVDTMDGDNEIDFSEEQIIRGLVPDENVDIRIVMKKDDLSSCIPFTRFRTIP